MQTRFINQKVGVVCWVLALSVGCNRTNTDPDVKPDEDCRVMTETQTSPTLTTLTTYNYDQVGQLTSSLVSYTTSSGISSDRDDYQYDTGGFLTQRTWTSKSGNSESKTLYTYQYENGRLAAVMTKGASGSSTVSSTYSYNAVGMLAKYTIGSSTYLFTNGVLTDGEAKVGGKTYPATVTNGRIVSQYLDALGVFVHREYNAAGQVSKLYNTDEKGNPAPFLNTLTYEYTTQPVKLSTPATTFKGHPTYSLYGAAGFSSRTVTTPPKGFESNSKVQEIQYKTNSKGYLTERIMTTTGYQAGQSKTVFVYGNCQ